MFERRLYYHVDWAMLGAILALCLIGVVQIYSATGGSSLYVTQLYGIAIGFVALVVCLTVDYRSLADKSHFIYLGVIALLVFVLFFGEVRGGSRRWIDFGALNLQPSEFAKAAVALALAKYFGESRRGSVVPSDLLVAGAITAVPFLVIYQQPDLGTAATLLPVLFIVAFAAGMPMRVFGVLALVAVLAAPLGVEICAPGLPERARVDLPGPRGGRSGGRVSATSSPHYHRVGRAVGKGIPEGHAGSAAFPSRGT